MKIVLMTQTLNAIFVSTYYLVATTILIVTVLVLRDFMRKSSVLICVFSPFLLYFYTFFLFNDVILIWHKFKPIKY